MRFGFNVVPRALVSLGLVFASTAGALVGTAAPASAAGAQCKIVLGDGGASSTIVANLDSDGPTVQAFKSVTASSFIRSTSGPCHFDIFNKVDLKGDFTTLGTGVTTRIRAGQDGIHKKDNGGGDTWRVRSVRVTLHKSPRCTVSVGHHNGVRMSYFGTIFTMPRVDRLYGVSGPAACTAVLYANPGFRGTDFRMPEFTHSEGIGFGYYAESIDLVAS